VIENNPARVNCGDSLGRVMAALAVSGILALGGIAASGLAADWVPGVRYVLGPAAMCVLFGFEVGALLLAAGRGTPARSE
jgi:hypothetical protein